MMGVLVFDRLGAEPAVYGEKRAGQPTVVDSSHFNITSAFKQPPADARILILSATVKTFLELVFLD